MPTALGWLQRFFADGRVRIEGQSLHRYRCTDKEFRTLEDVLHWTTLETGPECACFALYAAEWLRRRFEGGSWSWQGVLTQLDSPPARMPALRGISGCCVFLQSSRVLPFMSGTSHV